MVGSLNLINPEFFSIGLHNYHIKKMVLFVVALSLSKCALEEMKNYTRYTNTNLDSIKSEISCCTEPVEVRLSYNNPITTYQYFSKFNLLFGKLLFFKSSSHHNHSRTRSISSLHLLLSSNTSSNKYGDFES